MRATAREKQGERAARLGISQGHISKIEKAWTETPDGDGFSISALIRARVDDVLAELGGDPEAVAYRRGYDAAVERMRAAVDDLATAPPESPAQGASPVGLNPGEVGAIVEPPKAPRRRKAGDGRESA